ncbi:GHMP kinase [Methyloligella sp. 2.7D]|uniref:GHMP family kinase ATP-binding protein n=1 Tax=unclassified Methyloligella TaxID=2625955 RepID=UPI00157C2F74|nr:GHMP kinase [Methyloligella sp. GL2]QKP77775.1 GHMP kinase [Methyloligella sp. GL2]
MAELHPTLTPAPDGSGTPGGPSGAERVTVDTAARVHFGFFDPSGKSAHPFGSFGLGLDAPRTRLTLRRAEPDAVEDKDTGRAGEYLRDLAKAYGTYRTYSLNIDEAIPRHAGLGSGTQLALAVGTAFAALEGIELSLEEIAMRLGRGRRSGIGLGTFTTGGVVIDGGSGPDSLPPILARAAFPQDWRVLLIFNPGCKGLHGSGELAAFDQAPAFPDEAAAELRRRALEVALPALEACDFKTFCAEVGGLQQMMASYFAPYQGGGFVSTSVGAAVEWLRGEGLTGVGQSSWGPTGFALVESAAEGERLLAKAAADARFADLRFQLVSGSDRGASIETK